MPAQTRGRPRASKPKLSRDQILDAALDHGIASLTMRALAKRLGTDPMALYHYFPDKDALLAAAAERSFASLRPRMPRNRQWRARLRALARAYLRTIHRSRELLLYVTETARTSTPFDDHFFAAIAPLHLSAKNQRISRDALVDLLHGIALAGPSQNPTPQLDLLFRGIETLRAADTSFEARSPRSGSSRS